MGFSAKETLEKILSGESVRESLQGMDHPRVVEENQYMEEYDEFDDSEDELDEVELTDAEFDGLLSDIEFESDDNITQDEWDQMSLTLEASEIFRQGDDLYVLDDDDEDDEDATEAYKMVTVVRDGKKMKVKKKVGGKKRRMSAKQKMALKKMQKAANKPGAKKARARSMKKRKAMNL